MRALRLIVAAVGGCIADPIAILSPVPVAVGGAIEVTRGVNILAL